MCNAAQMLQRLMDAIFGPSMDDSVFLYLDDIIIVTTTFEKHLDVLQGAHRRNLGFIVD